MAERTAKQLPARGAELSAGAPFHPRLGDLALDLAKGGKIGVCVALPSDTSASYHLRPPGGGEDWRAKSDGTTLRPVPAPVTHVTPMRRDAIYDHRAQQAALPVTVHYEDGGTCETVLVLTPAQVLHPVHTAHRREGIGTGAHAVSPAVLTLAPPASARAPMRSPIAFRCEATAHDLSGSREILLATYRGRSPRLAARWLRAEAHRLARLLSPAPDALFLRDAPLTAAGPDVPRPDADLRAWADDDRAYEHALRSLATGRAFMFTMTDSDARYSLRVYPLPTRRPAPPASPVPARYQPHSPAGTGRHPRPRGRRTFR